MVRLEYASAAVKDLNSIYTFISDDSSFYAKKFIASLRQRIRILKSNPEFGRPFHPDKYSDLRQVLYKSYRIIYHVAADKVTVIAIIHQTQLPDNIVSLEDFAK